MNKETLGEHIRRRRTALRWTTMDLEKVSGISNATISRTETGVNKNPRWETVHAILNALDRAEGEVAIDELPKQEKAPTVSIKTDKPFKKAKGLLHAGFEIRMTYDEETDHYIIDGFAPRF